MKHGIFTLTLITQFVVCTSLQASTIAGRHYWDWANSGTGQVDEGSPQAQIKNDFKTAKAPTAGDIDLQANWLCGSFPIDASLSAAEIAKATKKFIVFSTSHTANHLKFSADSANSLSYEKGLHQTPTSVSLETTAKGLFHRDTFVNHSEFQMLRMNDSHLVIESGLETNILAWAEFALDNAVAPYGLGVGDFKWNTSSKSLSVSGGHSVVYHVCYSDAQLKEFLKQANLEESVLESAKKLSSDLLDIDANVGEVFKSFGSRDAYRDAWINGNIQD